MCYTWIRSKPYTVFWWQTIRKQTLETYFIFMVPCIVTLY